MDANFNLKAFCESVLAVSCKAPLSYRTEQEFVFRGVRITLDDGSAISDRINFGYTDFNSFLQALLDKGLMLNHYERIRVKQWYQTLV